VLECSFQDELSFFESDSVRRWRSDVFHKIAFSLIGIDYFYCGANNFAGDIRDGITVSAAGNGERYYLNEERWT
jgi:hypothetical protein